MSIKRKIALVALLTAFCSSAYAQKPFEGMYRIGGKDGKLNYLMAVKGNPFDGKPVTDLVFSEKDAKGDADPATHAFLGRLGDALVVHLDQLDSGWEVNGADMFLGESKGSAGGVVHAKNIKISAGEITGRLRTEPGTKMFNESYEINLSFHVKQPL